MIMRRRVLGALGAGTLVAALPTVAHPSPFRVSWVSPTRLADGSPFLDELRRGLAELGHVVSHAAPHPAHVPSAVPAVTA
jgi:hypothetical protein